MKTIKITAYIGGFKMIKVTSPFMQKEIIALLEKNEDPSYTYIKKQGIQLHFDTTSSNESEAADYAKQLLKKQDFAKGIALSVTAN